MKKIPQKLTYTKKIAAVNLSKIYFLKNAKKTCKSNKRNLNCDWIIGVTLLIYIGDRSINVGGVCMSP